MVCLANMAHLAEEVLPKTGIKHVVITEVADMLSGDFAAYLQQNTDLQPGDRIAVQLPNLIQYPIVVFGAMRAGLIVVNTNPLYTAREMEHQFNDAGAKALVCLANMAHLAEEVLPKTGIKHVVITEVADMLPPLKRMLINAVVKHVKKMVPAYSLPKAVKLNDALALGRGKAVSEASPKSDEVAVLQALLSAGTKTSFNCVTVDGDTSTSDTLMLFATARAGNPAVTDPADARLAGFREALDGLLIELAQLVAKDGEGARKFVTVRVTGAESDASAHRIAMSIANSPLVKTAVAGEDANWGRVVMAVGKAGEPADRDRLAIWFGDVRVAVQGARDPDYSEAAASAVMREPEITVRVDLGLGDGTARVWTCDLTKAYVEINGDYRS
ncbi:bifunctional ornithine acetyltransferase/N-acetylglutamate synthase [Methylobacterium organophilum]|nr:bifunctional ornithine acetyltransferase/N-acetylglutamate synthase [Methylobacterium organophilum]